MTSVFYLQGQIKSDGMGGAIKLLTIGKFLWNNELVQKNKLNKP
jgi:hypothetical protein